MTQGTILLVEDNQALRTAFRSLLQEHEYYVLEAESPSQAMTIGYQYTEPIDLLITDIVLPNMNGGELSVQLLRIHPEIRILFMSGYVRTNGPSDAMPILRKPFSIEEALEKVRKAISEGDPKS